MQRHNTTPSLLSDTLNIVQAIRAVTFWNEALKEQNAWCRDLLKDPTLSDAALATSHLEHQETITEIRQRLCDAQHQHALAMEASADRVAESVTGLIGHVALPFAVSPFVSGETL